MARAVARMAVGVTPRMADSALISRLSCNVGRHSANSPSQGTMYTPRPPEGLGTVNSSPPRGPGRARAPFRCGVVNGTEAPRSRNVPGW